MVSKRKEDDEEKPYRPPATTPEQRENQMVALAVDLAEKQLREGTASAQVISLYLKLGSSRERLDQMKIMQENELLKTKINSIASADRIEALYKEALSAMRDYGGKEPEAGEEDYYDDYDD